MNNDSQFDWFPFFGKFPSDLTSELDEFLWLNHHHSGHQTSAYAFTACTRLNTFASALTLFGNRRSSPLPRCVWVGAELVDKEDVQMRTATSIAFTYLILVRKNQGRTAMLIMLRVKPRIYNKTILIVCELISCYELLHFLRRLDERVFS